MERPHEPDVGPTARQCVVDLGRRHPRLVAVGVPAALALIALALALVRIDEPESMVFDELLFAWTANEYVENDWRAYVWDHPCSVFRSGEGCLRAQPENEVDPNRVAMYQWDHPPLGKMAIALGIIVAGNDATGWRIASAVAGAIGVAVAFRLGYRLSGSLAVAALAAALLTVDGLWFLYSRMGLIDIFVAVLALGALLAFTGYLRAPPDRMRWPLFLTGLMLGCGIATKWNAAYLALFIGLAVLVRFGLLVLAVRRGDASPEQRRGVAEHLRFVPLALGVVPVVVYLLSYSQFFLQGFTVSQFVTLQREMYHVHSTLGDYTDLSSRWWQWPLAITNVWFGEFRSGDGRVATIWASGNPVLWVAFVPAVAWACWRSWRADRVAMIVLAIGFFGLWLPWAGVERSTYTYHFLPAVPFGCIALAMAIVALWRAGATWRRVVAVGYPLAVLAVFIWLYPIWSYQLISSEGHDARIGYQSFWRDTPPTLGDYDFDALLDDPDFATPGTVTPGPVATPAS